MPVSLPPPTVPSLSDAAETQAQSQVGTFSFQHYTVNIHGADVITEEMFALLAGVSANLSDLVRRIGAACYTAGYLACQTHYARVGNTVYLLLDARGIDRVEGDKRITAYFKGLEGKEHLTARQLEPRRFLANAHTERAGLLVQPVIKDADDGATVMEVSTIQEEGVATNVNAEFGNPGTRFVGRYLGSVSASIGSPWGDEFTAGWREGISDLGSNTNDGNYREFNLGTSRVTPWGIFGVGGRKVDYDFETQGFRVDADFRIYDVRWLYPWFADFRQRFVTQVKFERTDSTAQFAQGAGEPLPPNLLVSLLPILSILFPPQTAEGQQGELLDERYNSVELVAFYSRRDQVFGRALLSDSSLTYRLGLKDEVAVPTGANLDYQFIRPVVSLKYPVLNNWELATTLAAQFSSDRMPQQQQWVLGGLDNLTAFLPGVAAGDEGALARFVLSTPTFTSFGMTFKPALLLEGGTTRFNNGMSEVRLADVGAKVDVTVHRHIDLTLAYATDIVSDNLQRDDADAKLYFRLRAQF